MTGLVKQYQHESVLDAAEARMRWIFDHFERVYASVSSGKDSDVLYHLARAEARRRGRKLHVFFLDQEAEYQGTVDLMRVLMHAEGVEPLWYQVPIRMTNATSYAEDQLYAWGPGEPWMRDKEPDAIAAIDGDYPERFYPFFDWWEAEQPAESAFLVGLRAEEGINRFRAVTKHPALPAVPWSTKAGRAGSVKFYPLYDWGSGDIWRYIATNGCPYNRVYDLLWALGAGEHNSLRVSNLIHEVAFRSLEYLHAVEPETYARLVKRIGGVHCAARHAQGPLLYDAKTLPAGFSTWRAYRDHLLATAPISEERRARFTKRFAGQGEDERVYQGQCRQILLGDHENNVPVVTARARAKKADKFARWRKLF